MDKSRITAMGEQGEQVDFHCVYLKNWRLRLWRRGVGEMGNGPSTAIIPHQVANGDAAGSWNPVGKYGALWDAPPNGIRRALVLKSITHTPFSV